MAIQNSDTAQDVERELTNYQRNLVDTCFEEGNFDSAIGLLDELRHPGVKPYPAHIRNAVAIALYPPPSAEDNQDTSQMDSTIPASPSKYMARHQRGSHTPAATASEAAQRLLKTYARSNTPESLLRALPNYGLSDLPGLSNILSSSISADDDGDSEISYLSRRIRDAKNCWELLREGFLKREVPGGDTATSTARRSRRGLHSVSGDEEGESSGVPAPVGRHVWPVLEWLLMCFEKDEAAVAARGQPRYSPLLLSQIPPARSASGSRWEVETPLDIVFYTLQQQDRSSLGARLLALLVNLTATVFVDYTMIANAVCARTLSLTARQLQTLFLLLPLSPTCSRFKVSLCKLCLASSTGGGRRARPKPQARAAPRPTPRQRGADADTTKASTDQPTPDPKETETDTVRRTFSTPPMSEILELLRGPSSSRALPTDVICQLKFQLVSAYGELQDQLEPSEHDPAWREAQENGEFTKAIDTAFAGARSPEEVMLVRSLEKILGAAGLYR